MARKQKAKPVLSSDENYPLTRSQQSCFDAIEYSFDNVLLVGKPGVGKSVLIRALINDGKKNYTIAAPTGLAALNINGRTLHSIFRIPVSQGIIHPTFNKFNTNDDVVNTIKYGIKTLIIDEISMVRADILDFVDRYMRYCKGNDKPFGGVQVVMVGDFFQLPPVVTREEVVQLKDAGYASPFAFDAKVFAENFKVIFLNEVLRQKGDNSFLEILDTVRVGMPYHSQLKKLNDRVGKRDGLCIALTATNAQADIVNQHELNKLDPASSKWFIADKFGEWPAMPCDERLELRIGAQVMVKMNKADRPPELTKGDFTSQVVNGTLGKVVDIFVPDENDEGTKGDNPYVEIEVPKIGNVKIYRKQWQRKIKERDPLTGDWDERVVASFEQMPLILAWAISMHKSQGQSFDRVHIDASKTFAPGQLYVALSRSRSLKGITFEAPLQAKKFWANSDVLRFANQFDND